MKRFYVASRVAMALVLLLPACSSSQEGEIVVGDTICKLIITAEEFVTDEKHVESRTNIDPTRGFSWALKDTIGIFPEKGDQLPFEMSSGAGTNVATISGGSWWLKISEGYAAYYPFSRQNYFTDRGNIHFSYVGQEQIGDNTTTHLGAFDLMAADNAESNGTSLNFNFNHLGCILRMYVNIPNAGTYSLLSLTAEEAAFAKEVKLDLSKTSAELTHVESSKSISLSLNGFTSPSDNYTATFFLMSAPFDLAGKTITLKLKAANGYIYTGTMTPSKAYVAQMMYNMRFNSLTLDSNPPIGIGGEFETSDSEM